MGKGDRLRWMRCLLLIFFLTPHQSACADSFSHWRRLILTTTFLYKNYLLFKFTPMRAPTSETATREIRISSSTGNESPKERELFIKREIIQRKRERSAPLQIPAGIAAGRFFAAAKPHAKKLTARVKTEKSEVSLSPEWVIKHKKEKIKSNAHTHIAPTPAPNAEALKRFTFFDLLREGGAMLGRCVRAARRFFIKILRKVIR